ncbi:MAG: DedA family protein [Patescibacteria group bacterium]|jgi:membrane protein DedA with SNARE-associated domain
MQFSLETVMSWLLVYRYLVLFPLVMVEGPIVTVLAGFIASLGYINFWLAYAVVTVGDLVGDCVYYVIGRWGRGRFIDRWGRFIGITKDRIATLDQHFDAHTGKTLLAGKVMHAVGGAILVAAGVARVPFLQFIWYNLLGTLPKSLLLIVVGYYFGKAYASIDSYLNYVGVAIMILVVFVLLFYFLLHRLFRRRSV